MKNTRMFCLKICHFLVVKFSVYLNRRVFVMIAMRIEHIFELCSCIKGWGVPRVKLIKPLSTSPTGRSKAISLFFSVCSLFVPLSSSCAWGRLCIFLCLRKGVLRACGMSWESTYFSPFRDFLTFIWGLVMRPNWPQLTSISQLNLGSL